MTTSPLKVEELKACPFCGRGDGVLFIRPSDNWRYMQCLSCLGSSGARADVESAIRAWNQRAAIVVELPDEVNVLLNHLEDVLPFDVFNLIDVKKWNAVSSLSATGITVKGD